MTTVVRDKVKYIHILGNIWPVYIYIYIFFFFSAFAFKLRR